MSRSVLLLAVAIAALPSAADSGPRIGAALSFNYSRLAYAEELPVWDTGWRASVGGGLIVSAATWSHVSMVTGVRFVRQGNSVAYDTGAPGEFEIKQDYLSIPMLAQIAPLDRESIFIVFGPEFGYLLAAKLVDRPNQPGETQDNIISRMNRVNVTLDVGIGCDLPLGERVGMLQLRYAHGVMQVSKSGDWYSPWKTRSVEALVGILW